MPMRYITQVIYPPVDLIQNNRFSPDVTVEVSATIHFTDSMASQRREANFEL